MLPDTIESETLVVEWDCQWPPGLATGDPVMRGPDRPGIPSPERSRMDCLKPGRSAAARCERARELLFQDGSTQGDYRPCPLRRHPVFPDARSCRACYREKQCGYSQVRPFD